MDSSRYLRRKSLQVSFIWKQALSKLGFTLSGGRTILKFSFNSWFPSTNSGPLRSCSEFYLAPYPQPSPYTGSLQSRSDPAPCSPSSAYPFTHVYTSPDPPDPEGKTSLFRQSEFSPNFRINRIASPNFIGFSWEFIRCELVNLFNLYELVNSQLRQTR